MRTRIMSGAVLIVILFTCLYFGGWVTFGFSLFISLVGMYELIKVKKLEKTGLAVVGYIAAITYYFILLLNDPAYILLLLVASSISSGLRLPSDTLPAIFLTALVISSLQP